MLEEIDMALVEIHNGEAWSCPEPDYVRSKTRYVIKGNKSSSFDSISQIICSVGHGTAYVVGCVGSYWIRELSVLTNLSCKSKSEHYFGSPLLGVKSLIQFLNQKMSEIYLYKFELLDITFKVVNKQRLNKSKLTKFCSTTFNIDFKGYDVLIGGKRIVKHKESAVIRTIIRMFLLGKFTTNQFGAYQFTITVMPLPRILGGGYAKEWDTRK